MKATETEHQRKRSKINTECDPKSYQMNERHRSPEADTVLGTMCARPSIVYVLVGPLVTSYVVNTGTFASDRVEARSVHPDPLQRFSLPLISDARSNARSMAAGITRRE